MQQTIKQSLLVAVVALFAGGAQGAFAQTQLSPEKGSLYRQASIQFDVYSITLDAGDQHGAHGDVWATSLHRAGLKTLSSLVPTNLGRANASVLPNSEGDKDGESTATSSAILKALSQHGYEAHHKQVTVLTFNRQWNSVALGSTVHYVAEAPTAPASTKGLEVPSLLTVPLVMSDKYEAMPQVMADDRIFLQLAISLFDGPSDASFGVSKKQDAAPSRLNTVDLQFAATVRPGEIVAVTGLSRTVAVDDNQRLAEGAPLIAGGTRKTQFKREHFLVFVRPVLM